MLLAKHTKFLLIVASLCLSLDSHSQSLTDKEEDSIALTTVIRKQFTKILTGPLSLPGNYGAFDVKDAQLTASGYTNFKNNQLLTFNIDAGVTEGMAGLFNNSKVSPNVKIEIKYSTLLKKKQSITTDDDKHELIDQRIDNNEKYYEEEIKAIPRKRAKDTLNKTYYSDSLARIKEAIPETEKLLAEEKDPVKIQKLRTKLIAFIDTELKFQHLIDSMNTISSSQVSSFALTKEKNTKRETLVNKIEAIGARFSWVSFGYKLVNRSFFLFDAAQASDAQVKQKDFTAHQFSVELNTYSWHSRKAVREKSAKQKEKEVKKKKNMTDQEKEKQKEKEAKKKIAPLNSWFFGSGLAVLYDDTFSTLSKTEITETTTHSSSPAARTEQKKYTAFKGEYKSDILYFRPYLEFYYFLLKNKSAGIHLYPDVLFADKRKPLTNIGAGLYFSFTDKNDKEGKAIVNAELYVKFNDVANNLEKKNVAFHERNDIGVRLAFPFNFN